MSEQLPELPPAFRRKVVVSCNYRGQLQSELAYGEEERQFDVYYPENTEQACPALVFVLGFSDRGFQARMGRKMRELAPYQSWARLVAAHGMAAVLYSSVEPVVDTLSLLRHLEQHGEELGIDSQRLAIWSCSGNVPNALHALSRVPPLCAVLNYGFMMDLDGSTVVAETSAQFGFADPGMQPEELPATVPMLIVKAGQDEFPGLNAGIDAFVAACRSRGGDCQLLEYPAGVHAFDVLDDSEESQHIVRQSLDYLIARLLEPETQ